MTASTLIPVIAAEIGERTVNAVNARTLHEFLEVGRDFSNWIKGRIDEFSFTEGEDFAVCSPDLASKTGSGGHNRLDYLITLDMAKELAMVERNEKGRQVRRYFIDCEEKWRTIKPSLHALLRGVLRDLERSRDSFVREGLTNQAEVLFGALAVSMPALALIGQPIKPVSIEEEV